MTRSRPLIPLLVLAATSVLFWWPCLLGGKVPVTAVYQQQMSPFGAPQSPPPRAWDALLWDSMAQFYPWRVLLQRGLRSGELPLWNPHQYCGYPFVGNGQSALFYPPNWLLLIVDAKYFLGLSLALHWFLAGVLTFFLARTLRLRPAAALVAGLLYQSSGFMIAWAELPTVVNTMAWLPGAWLGVELLFRSRGTGFLSRAPRRQPEPGGLESPPHAGLALLSTSLGLSLLAGHLQFAAYVWLTTALYALARATYRWATRRPAPVAPLVLSVLLGLGIGLPQVLPSLELGRYSPRGETKVSAEGWRFQQRRALQPIELLTFAWPEALGDPVTGTYPGISYTEHCGYAGVLALILAALGVALRRDRWAIFYALGTVAAVAIAMAGPLAWLLYYGLPKLGLAGGFARILGVYTLLLAVLAGMGLDALLAALTHRSRPAPPEGPHGWLAASSAARRAPSGPGHREPITGKPSSLPTLVAGVTLFLIAAELFLWGWRFLPLAPQEQVYPDTALTRLLTEKSADPNYRVLCITPRNNWTIDRLPNALLPPNAATVYGWYSPQGYDSLSLATYRAWIERGERADVSPLTNGNMMLLNRADSAELNLAAVKWLATLAPLTAPSLRLQRLESGAYLYERGGLGYSLVHTFPREGSALLVGRSLNTLTVETTDDATYLRVAQPWYPGWRAYTDGRLSQRGPQADGSLLAVPISPGTHDLWLAFYPASLVVGLFLGLLSLALLAGLLTATRRSLRR